MRALSSRPFRPPLAAFLPYIEVLDFPATAAVHYAGIRADLKKRRVLIGANDLLIAAHARDVGLGALGSGM